MDLHYVDDGALREQDQVPLEDFLSFKDRAQLTGRGQPFFSGREGEINAFREAANALLLGHRGNATIIVEGPPGSGKSALLAQCQEEMRTLPPAGNSRRWLPVLMTGAQAMSPSEIMTAVDDAILHRLAQDLVHSSGGSAPAQRLAALLGDRVLGNALSAARGILDRGASAMGFSIGAKAPPPGTLQQAAHMRGREWADWQIVLLIDEAQGISNAGPGAIRDTLSSIHQGIVRAPLSFCAFGLAGTMEALSSVDVSRPAGGRHMMLLGLDARAARMAVRRCFAQYGVAHAEAWEEAILERSANWPQHVATYLNGALTVLQRNAQSPEVMGDARRAPLAEALSLGDGGRRGYYDLRIRRLNRDNVRHARYARALVPMFRERDGILPIDVAIDALEAPPLSLPAQEADRFLADATHSGFLSGFPEGPLRLPIPSFASHLMGEQQPLPGTKG